MILPSYIGVNNAFVFPTGGLSPVNITPPVVTGVGLNGQTLSSTDGVWGNSPTGFTYQWQSNGVNIPGATNSTYKITSVTEGTSLTCDVTASNGFGSNTASSNAIHDWIPTNTVASAYSWWDHSDPTQVSNNISDITQVGDKGNLNETLSQPNILNQPTLTIAGQNGLNVATFVRAGSPDFLQGTSLSKYNFVHNGNNATVAVVMKATEGLGGGPNRQVYAGTTITSGSPGFLFRASDTDTINAAISRGSGFITGVDANDYVGLGSWSIVVGLVDANNSTQSNRIVMRLDGSASSSSSSGSGNPSSSNAGSVMTIGSNPTTPGGNNNNFNGDIGELVILNNQGDEEKLEGYMAWKWGLVANLPVGHPYKSSPPPAP